MKHWTGNMRNKHPLKKEFTERGSIVEIHLGRETELDPDEKSVQIDLIPPISVTALLVNNLSPSQLQWKMGGQYTKGGEVIIFEAHLRSTLELSQKLIIDEIDYYGYLDGVGSNFAIRRLSSDYIQFYAVTQDA